MAQNMFSKDNPVFASFAFYSMVVLMKLIVVQLTVVYRRITMNVCILMSSKFTLKYHFHFLPKS